MSDSAPAASDTVATPLRGFFGRRDSTQATKEAPASSVKEPSTKRRRKDEKAPGAKVDEDDADDAGEPMDEAEEGEQAADFWDWDQRVTFAKTTWALSEASSPDDPHSAAFDPVAAASRLADEGKRTLFIDMLTAIRSADEGPQRAFFATANLFRQVMSNSTHGCKDLIAVLTLLVPRKPHKRVRQYHLAIQAAFPYSKIDLDEDLADAALAAKRKQKALFTSKNKKRIPVSDVADVLYDMEQLPTVWDSGNLTQAGKSQYREKIMHRVQSLLGLSSATDEETKHIVRMLQGQSKLEKWVVLRALAHALVLVRKAAVAPDQGAATVARQEVDQECAEEMARMEEIVNRAHGFCCGDASRLVPNLLEGKNLDAAIWGVQVLPMKVEVSKDLETALAQLGDHALLCEWMHEGDRVQVHVRDNGAGIKVFTADQGLEPSDMAVSYRPCTKEIAAVLKDGLKNVREGIFEVIFRRPKNFEGKQAEEDPSIGENKAPTVVVIIFDVLRINGQSLTGLPLRVRRRELRNLVSEGPELRLAKSRELAPGVQAPVVIEELNYALSAGFLAAREDREMNRVTGLVLKRLDGPDARYMAGGRSSTWQVIRKPEVKGAEADSMLFQTLSEAERAVLPEPDELHFSIISGMRTRTPEGVKDILNTQAMFKAVGVSPKWYVDTASVQDYCALGLDAVIGGKLIPARNLALEDACNLGKVCVQVSDDISRWEFYHGEEVGQDNQQMANAAWRRAERYQVSPVAAARYLLAKMRSSEKRPKLGGVYPLGNAARGFLSNHCTYAHFILGDFFVSEPCHVRFDTKLTLKEDYDYTCSHLEAFGAVLRCNRLVITAKHETNAGGACAIRDSEGKEERKNMAILKEKWPGAIRDHTMRANQVVLHWGGYKGRAVPSSDDTSAGAAA